MSYTVKHCRIAIRSYSFSDALDMLTVLRGRGHPRSNTVKCCQTLLNTVKHCPAPIRSLDMLAMISVRGVKTMPNTVKHSQPVSNTVKHFQTLSNTVIYLGFCKEKWKAGQIS